MKVELEIRLPPLILKAEAEGEDAKALLDLVLSQLEGELARALPSRPRGREAPSS